MKLSGTVVQNNFTMFKFEAQDEIDEINDFVMNLLRKTRPRLTENQRKIIAEDLVNRAVKAVSLEAEESPVSALNSSKSCECKRNNSMFRHVRQGEDLAKLDNRSKDRKIATTSKEGGLLNKPPSFEFSARHSFGKGGISKTGENKRNNSMLARVKQGVYFTFSARPSSFVKKETSTKIENHASQKPTEAKAGKSRDKENISSKPTNFSFSARASFGKGEKIPEKPTPEEMCRAKRRAAFQDKRLLQDKAEANVNYSKRYSFGNNGKTLTSTPRKSVGDKKNVGDYAKVYVDDVSHGAPEVKKMKWCGSQQSVTESEESMFSSTSGDCSRYPDLDEIFARLCLKR